jgi:Flp pilus assembly protein TadD
MTLAALNRDGDALASLDRALALAPELVEALNNRGNVYLKMGRSAEALADFEQALTLAPNFLPARLNCGNALTKLGRFAEAIARYDALLALQPGHAETIYNRGIALFGLGRLEEAVAAYDVVLAITPAHVSSLLNRGMALQALNRHREAIEHFDRAAALDRSNADARHNAALSRLTLGEFRRGLEDYEWRWQRTGMPPRRRFGKPLWLGEYPLGRRTLLVHAEQGLGDVIQFVRYVPQIARSGAKVVLEVQAALTTVLARVEGVTTVVARGDALPAYDVQCPLASLPRALRTDMATLPAKVPYLSPSADYIVKWRARIDHLAEPRAVVAWAGSTSHANDRNRSIALARLAPVLANQGVRFVSIQRDLRDGDAEFLARRPDLMHIGAELEDFEDAAALVALADLVISVDTAVVHLAGALGRPTWILLPFMPDWRWMLGREDSPWYPTARLFRQPAPGDWDSVIARVGEELSCF